MIIHHDFTQPQTCILGADRRPLRETAETLFIGFSMTDSLSPLLIHEPGLRHLAMSRVLNMDGHEFRSFKPRQIFSPLISGRFDALDLAAKLNGFNFKGRYRAVVSTLPNSALVCREIGLAYPGVDFDIVTTAGLAHPQDILELSST